MRHTILALAGALMLSTGAMTAYANATSLPDCSNSGILAKVNKQLSIGEKNVVMSGDPIARIGRIHQHRLRDNGPRMLAQRYCHATGYTENGRRKRVYYVIEENAGFSGYGFGVEACILGRDPWRVHGANCRSVR